MSKIVFIKDFFRNHARDKAGANLPLVLLTPYRDKLLAALFADRASCHIEGSSIVREEDLEEEE